MAHRLQKEHWKIKNCCDADVYTRAPANPTEFYHQRNRWYKGNLLNAIKYRRMIFNREYGDFGFFQIPVNVSQVIISVLVLLFILKVSLTPVFTFIGYLHAINFQLQYLLADLSLNFSLQEFLLGLNYQNYTIIASLLTLSVIMLYLSLKLTEESTEQMKKLALIPYLFFYFIMVGAVCTVVLAEVILGREKRW